MTIYDNVKTLVEEAVDEVTSAASSGEFDFNPPAVTIPAIPFTAEITATVPSDPTYAPTDVPTEVIQGALSRASYNAVSSVLGAMSLTDMPAALNYYDPVRPDELPDHGVPEDPGMPPESGYITVPDSAGLTLVDAPVITVGLPPDLEPIPTLDYVALGFDKLDVVVPEPGAVPDVEKLADPEQLVVVLDQRLLNAIKHTLTGQDIMSVQQQLYNLATHDLRRERVDVERKLFSESAARGFGDANGGLFEKLADVNYAARLKDGESYGEGRDFLYNAAKEKLIEAVQSAIALETANFAVHMAYASKLVEVYEINSALHNEIFNLTVDMYGLYLQGVNAVIESYNTYVGVVVAEQQAQTAELSVARAQLQSNKARITMYQAQGRTAAVRADVFESEISQSTLPVEEFTAYIDGLLQNVDIQQANIQAYKEALTAYSDFLKIDKAKIDAYGAQIRAEGSAVDVFKANWDLYGNAHRALSGQNSAVGEYNRASLQALSAEIGVFRAAADQQNSYLRAIGTWVDQNRSISSDYTRAVGQMVSYTAGSNDTLVDLETARLRVELSQADFAATEDALDAQREAAQATIDAGLLASEATTAAGLASAAYAIRSVSADLNSGSSDAESQSFSSSVTEGNTYNKSYSYTKSGSI